MREIKVEPKEVAKHSFADIPGIVVVEKHFFRDGVDDETLPVQLIILRDGKELEWMMYDPALNPTKTRAELVNFALEFSRAKYQQSHEDKE